MTLGQPKYRHQANAAVQRHQKWQKRHLARCDPALPQVQQIEIHNESAHGENQIDAFIESGIDIGNGNANDHKVNSRQQKPDAPGQLTQSGQVRLVD